MSIYAKLASTYDALFPASHAETAFLAALAREGGNRAPRALDAGCATGAQALALADLGWTAAGIDSEAAMVAAARDAAARAGLKDRAGFDEASILDIGELFEKGSLDLVLCLGNTLPHLLGAGAASFLAQARGLLRPGGALVLQCLNYALPGIGSGYRFPDLAAPGVVMRRRYEDPPPEAPDALRFVVELARDGGREVEETLLQSLPPARVAALLEEAGFSPPALYSSWAGGRFDEERDLLCIYVARA
jgi:glycine/sarcosine N-methyltransferase